jgi:MFS transporter, ACS family, D-galactonate transporter
MQAGCTRSSAFGGSDRGISARSCAAILVGRMSWAMINFALLTWGPSYLAQARGFDLKQIGGATFVIFLAGMFGSLGSGFLVDKLRIVGWGALLFTRARLASRDSV